MKVHDFWHEFEKTREDNQIVHQEFVVMESGDVGKLVTRNHWKNGSTKICEDERTIVFSEDEFGRHIDFRIALKATAGAVTFGETKEGTFAVRVNGPLTVDANVSARLLNDRELADGAV